MSNEKPTIAVLGGTGDLGGGLARRWAKAGYTVIIGSRSAEKGIAAAKALSEALPGTDVSGDDLAGAATKADIVAVTVPYANHGATLEQIKPAVQGKIVIDTTVPLRPPKVGRVQLPEAGSAAQEAQNLLGEDVRVVSAFQNVAAHHLQADHDIDCDVLVSGNNVEAREVVIGLAADGGMKAWHAGPINNAAAAEALTSILIQINKREKAHSGIRITLGK